MGTYPICYVRLLNTWQLVYDGDMKKIVIANWKSHKTPSEVAQWMQEFTARLGTSLVSQSVTSIVAPSELYLSAVAAELEYGTLLAAQDVSPYPTGKYTGETAASQLAALGVKYVILGHSERRQYLGENDALVARKARQCVDAGLTPVICVDDDYIDSQANALEPELRARCIVAYEALSAIGTGENVQATVVAAVTEKIKDVFGAVPVLYGGSVTAGNVTEYFSISDGWLVGGASLSVEDFFPLLTAVANAGE